MRPAMWARMRPALCGPHASQPPAMPRVLALALAPTPVRPARPRLCAACVPSVRLPAVRAAIRASASPACPTACSPSRVRAGYLSIYRLADYKHPIVDADPRSSPALPSVAAISCARLPSLGPRGAAPGPQLRRFSCVLHRDLGLHQNAGFYLGSAETVPLVVLQKQNLLPPLATKKYVPGGNRGGKACLR